MVHTSLQWEHMYLSSFSTRQLPIYVVGQEGDIGDSSANANSLHRNQRPALLLNCLIS